MAEILDVATDQFHVIGTVLDPGSYMLVSSTLKNVPPLIPLSELRYPTPAPTNLARYYIEAR